MARGCILRAACFGCALVLCGAGAGGRDGLGSWLPDVTPTNGQEVLTYLSDPGLEGEIAILLWHPLRRGVRR